MSCQGNQHEARSKQHTCPTCGVPMEQLPDKRWWICPHNGTLIKEDMEVK